MTDGAMLTEILAALEIPCDKCSFHGKLDALAAGLGIDTEGRLLGDVLDDIAAKEGIQRDDRLYGAYIRKLYDYVTNGEDVTLEGNPLVLANSMGKPLKECVVSWEPEQEGSGEPYPAGGGKNKLPFPANSTKYPQSRNGLTVTANADGSYTINGTATADTWFNICSLYGKGFDDFGAFALSGCPNGGSTSTAYYLALYTGTKWYSDTGDGTTGQIGTLAAGARIEISIKAGYVATNLRVCPQLEHGSTVTAYAPYANIRPIHGRNSVNVERCGENLWEIGDVSFKTYKEVSISIPPGVYTLSYNIDTEAETATSQIGILVDGGWKYYQVNNKARAIIQVTATRGITGMRFYAGSGPAYTNAATYKDISLKVGTAAPATYTPYTGSTTTLTLPSIVYGGEVGANGEGQETWKLLTLDGSESWYTLTDVNTFYLGRFPVWGTVGQPKKAYCSIAIYNGGRSVEKNGEFAIVGFADTNGWIGFRFTAYTLETWKAYLAAQYAAGTPVQIAYKLNTPTPFSATGGGAIPTVKGTNTLLTDADTIKATYRCNVRAAEQELDTLYTDLLQELEE